MEEPDDPPFVQKSEELIERVKWDLMDHSRARFREFPAPPGLGRFQYNCISAKGDSIH